MKLFFRNVPVAIGAILFGLINILIYFGIIELEKINLISFVLIFIGLYLVYKELNSNRVGLITLGVISFFFGLTLFILNRLHIFFFYKTAFAILLFIIGMVFLFLFLNNYRNKVFLQLALFLIFVSVFSIYLKEYLPFIKNIELINKIILQNWHFVFIVIGLILIAGRAKK